MARLPGKPSFVARDVDAEAAFVIDERQRQRDATDAIRASTEHVKGLNVIVRDVGNEPDVSKREKIFDTLTTRLATRTGGLISNPDLLKAHQRQANEQVKSARARVRAGVEKAEFAQARTDIDGALQTHFELYTERQADEPQRVQALAQLNDMLALASARGVFTADEVEEKRQRFLVGAVREDAALQAARDPQGFLAALDVKNGRFAMLSEEDRVVMARAGAQQAVSAAIDTDPSTVEEVLRDPLVAQNLDDQEQDKAREDARMRIEAIEKSDATNEIMALAARGPEFAAGLFGRATIPDLNGAERPVEPLTIATVNAARLRLQEGGARPEAVQLHEELHETLIAQGGEKQASLEPETFGQLMQAISGTRITPGKPIDVEASVTALVGVQARVLRAQRRGEITSAQAESLLTRVIPAVMAGIERDGMDGARPVSPVADLYESGFALIGDLLDDSEQGNNPALGQALFSALAGTIDGLDPQSLADPETKERERQELGRALRGAFEGFSSGQEFDAPLEFPEVGNSSSRGAPLPDRNPQRAGGEAEPTLDVDDVLDGLVLLLDAAGTAPGVGIGADAVSALISLGRGNLDDAGLSVLAMAPIFGQAAGSAKIVRALKKVREKAGKGLGRSTRKPGSAGGERAGLNFTPKTKARLDADNAKRNDGVNKCENCRITVSPGKKSQRGVTPPQNERQRDHIIPRSKGGDGTFENGDILCRKCNLLKRDK